MIRSVNAEPVWGGAGAAPFHLWGEVVEELRPEAGHW